MLRTAFSPLSSTEGNGDSVAIYLFLKYICWGFVLGECFVLFFDDCEMRNQQYHLKSVLRRKQDVGPASQGRVPQLLVNIQRGKSLITGNRLHGN